MSEVKSLGPLRWITNSRTVNNNRFKKELTKSRLRTVTFKKKTEPVSRQYHIEYVLRIIIQSPIRL